MILQGKMRAARIIRPNSPKHGSANVAQCQLWMTFDWETTRGGCGITVTRRPARLLRRTASTLEHTMQRALRGQAVAVDFECDCGCNKWEQSGVGLRSLKGKPSLHPLSQSLQKEILHTHTHNNAQHKATFTLVETKHKRLTRASDAVGACQKEEKTAKSSVASA